MESKEPGYFRGSIGGFGKLLIFGLHLGEMIQFDQHYYVSHRCFNHLLGCSRKLVNG